MDLKEAATRIGEGLRARAPEHNRSGWAARMADEIGVAERTFRMWLYGEGTPGLAAFVALCRHPEIGPDFGSEVLAGTGLTIVPASEDLAAASDKQRLARQLREMADALASEVAGGRDG